MQIQRHTQLVKDVCNYIAGHPQTHSNVTHQHRDDSVTHSTTSWEVHLWNCSPSLSLLKRAVLVKQRISWHSNSRIVSVENRLVGSRWQCFHVTHLVAKTPIMSISGQSDCVDRSHASQHSTPSATWRCEINIGRRMVPKISESFSLHTVHSDQVFHLRL